MSVPDAAISFLLQNLAQAIEYNVGLIAGTKDSAKQLQQQLQNLKGALADFSRLSHDSEYVRSLVKDIRTLVFEAEDAIDTFLLCTAVQKGRNWVEQKFHKLTDYPTKLASVGADMKSVSEKIEKLRDNQLLAGIAFVASLPSQEPVEGPREEPIVEEEHVVGFEDAAKYMRDLLIKGEETLEVVSIVGMLGLGKTTLAKLVFKDPAVDYEFMIQALVYVSKEYKKSEVLLKILSSFTDTSAMVNMGEAELEKTLKRELQGKQYLIVLDDVWDTADWDKFKDVFPKNNKRCRVLITTRYEQVAKHSNSVKEPYRLDFLPMDKSRELLRWRVFKNEDERREFQAFEVKIVEKCKGLPLAIVVIAGILLNDPTSGSWWSQVAESAEVYFVEERAETNKLIEYMYKHLPNELKLCFLYLGVFREDFEIPVWKLLRLWIAEGLIQQKERLNIEDQAEQYLEELARRNLVMVGERRSNGKIKTCRMHDTLREFCKTEAAAENMFEEIKRDNLSRFLSGDATLQDHRRLCINNINALDYISQKPSGGKRVRSFLTFVKEETNVEAKFVNFIPETFKLLRVLEVESLIFTKFPPPLCNLVLLRYIALSLSSQIEKLPVAMSSLAFLQTLIVNAASPNLDVKLDIWKMPQFRHLHSKSSTKLPSPPSDGSNHGAGQQIQTLSTISPESCTSEVLSRVPQVRKLGIRGKIAEGSKFFGILRTLTSVKNLKLLNDDLKSKLCYQSLENIFPRNLTKLTLLNTFLDWKEMSKLAELEYLEVLKLKDYAFEGTIWVSTKGGFRFLQHLHIGPTSLAVWQPSADHFPKLRSLKLMGCDKLEAFPQGFKDSTTLQTVTIHSTNPNVASTARRLQVLKLQQENEDKQIKAFKLSVYPPEQQN